MPLAVIEIVSTADRLPVLGYILAERGQLIGMTAVVIDGTPEIGQLLVEAGIMRGGRGAPFKAAVPLMEYAYFSRQAFWSGNLDLEPADEIYLEIRGAEAYRVRLNGLIRIEVD